MKFFHKLFLTAAAATLLLSSEALAAGKTAVPDERAAFDAACQVMSQVQSQHVTGTLAINSPLIGTTLQLDSRMQAAPSHLMAGTVTANTADPLGRDHQSAVPFYLERGEQAIDTYIEHDGKWEHHTQDISKLQSAANAPKIQALLNKAQIFGPVTLVREDKTATTLKAKLNSRGLAEAMSSLGQWLPKKPASYATLIQVLKAADTIDTLVTIDKATRHITAASCDLTPACRAAAKILLQQPNLSPMQQLVIQQLAGNASIRLDLHYSDFDQPMNLTIPDEVRGRTAADTPAAPAADDTAGTEEAL